MTNVYCLFASMLERQHPFVIVADPLRIVYCFLVECTLLDECTLVFRMFHYRLSLRVVTEVRIEFNLFIALSCKLFRTSLNFSLPPMSLVKGFAVDNWCHRKRSVLISPLLCLISPLLVSSEFEQKVGLYRRKKLRHKKPFLAGIFLFESAEREQLHPECGQLIYALSLRRLPYKLSQALFRGVRVVSMLRHLL